MYRQLTEVKNWLLALVALYHLRIVGWRYSAPEAVKLVVEQVGGNQAALGWNSDSTTH